MDSAWRLRVAGGALASFIGFVPLSSGAAQENPLPSPLTLEQALTIADQAHPDRLLADAALEQARARYRQAGAVNDFELGFSAELRAIDPSEIAVYQTHNDSLARLNLSKQLYDFGRSARTQEAAEAALDSQKWQLQEIRLQRRLEVMQRFFEVLLADLQYARDNEALAIAYIRYDRAVNRQELGKASDIDVLDLQSRFQQVRLRSAASANQQRISRSQLAISLNRPNDLPADLATPELELEALGQEVGDWLDRALSENPRLRSLRADVEAARKQLRASEAADNPVLRGELEAATYERELGGRNPLSAALIFELPLYSGNRNDAKTAEQRALLQQREAELASYELQVRQQVLDIWLELERLRLQAQELEVTADYRDLYLDRSRTLYELDMQTDLGDSMSQIADIQWQKAKNRYAMLLQQARLKALAGDLGPLMKQDVEATP
jgi:outer membrane protein TolC